MTSGAPSLWPAPAKLNLFLHILGRRTDGYHELQSCFQFIDLQDELALAVTFDGSIRRNAEIDGVPSDADLCLRAARALQHAAQTPLGVEISVTKRIPMGGGLGGGSSDAATCLVALNKLWGLSWPVQRLADLGLKLGADVPVFIHGRAAWAEGVGEKLTQLIPPWAPCECNYLILNPNVSVSTAAVFQDPELTRNSLPITIRSFLASGGRNDCVGVVRRRYPQVAQALDWLSRHGDARMTGTGACIFLACDTRELGERILRQLPAGLTGYLVRGLNNSPLLDRLAVG